jgi:hypothetical protein
MKEILTFLKNLLAESGYRALNKHEKACICVNGFKLSHQDAATVSGLGKSAVGRAVRSKRQGRDVGKSGAVSKLVDAEKTVFIQKIEAAMADGQDVTYQAAEGIVRHRYYRGIQI